MTRSSFIFRRIRPVLFSTLILAGAAGPFASATLSAQEVVTGEERLGRLALKDGRPGEAVRHLTAALAGISPASKLERAYVLFYRAQAWRLSGSPEAALTDINESVRIWFDAHERHNDLYIKERARVLSAAGRPDAAKKQLELLKLPNGSNSAKAEFSGPSAYYQRGNLHGELKDFDAALADHTKAVNLSPDTKEYVTAWLYAVRDHARAAGSGDDHDFDPYYARITEQVRFFNTVGRLQMEWGNPRAAAELMEKSMEKGGSERIKDYQSYLKSEGVFEGEVDGRRTAALEAALRACIEKKCGLRLNWHVR